MFSSLPASQSRTSDNSHLEVVSRKQSGGSPSGFPWLTLLFIIASSFLLYHIYASDKKVAPGVVETPEGEIALSPERQAKLDRELKEIDHATQYALVATLDGNYPCLSCPFSLKTIYLYKGNIWKYGTTRKKESERYPGGNYGANNLVFVPMYLGTYGECLKREKILIYNYPLLPEATEREIILARPPGNKYDS